MFKFLIVVLVCLLAVNADSPSCLDENGNKVDGWIVLKQARSFNYYYYTSSTWKKSSYDLSQASQGMVMKTAAQAYTYPNDYIMGMYNDEVSIGSVSSSHAHAKGILMTSAIQGFWLVHSMPKWPAAYKKGGSPGAFPQDDFGQSIQCITVSASTANTIASNLMMENVYIYGKVNYNTMNTKLPAFANWLAGKKDTTRTTSTTVIKSVGGSSYVQFSKAKAWGKDLWDDLVAPYYKAALNVETWRNGVGGRFGSICSSPSGPKKQTYNVYAVATVKMPDGTSWAGTDDHSKWAVSRTSTSGLSCVGGINRMCSQELRGGGAVCQQAAGPWKAFSSAVATTEPCWQYGKPCNKECYWCKASASTYEKFNYAAEAQYRRDERQGKKATKFLW